VLNDHTHRYGERVWLNFVSKLSVIIVLAASTPRKLGIALGLTFARKLFSVVAASFS
jgi:hypothetical protein